MLYGENNMHAYISALPKIYLETHKKHDKLTLEPVLSFRRGSCPFRILVMSVG